MATAEQNRQIVRLWESVGERREALEPRDFRRLGVPKRLMSDFEIRAAVFRDRNTEEPTEDAATYDRRGLLNVIAYLVAEQVGEVRDR